jgi:hypothetical protein
MDVAFILDYTGSMGGVIETVKASLSDIVTAIGTEVGAGNYRLGLVTVDEVINGGTVNYATSPTYTSLPAPQRYFNTGTGVDQYITAMSVFSNNNEGSVQAQLNALNEPLPLMPLGTGIGGPEPTDIALDIIINNDFLGQLRLNVAKYILIFTDNLPGGTDDTNDGTDQVVIDALEAQCVAKGIKVFVIGVGANSPIWQGLATGTGGTFNSAFDSEVIITAIVAACGDLIPPVANAGTDQILASPATSTTLDGSASSAEGVITDYLWEKISGGAATITSPTSAITTVTGMTDGEYVFRLTVTDDQALQDTDFMGIDINIAPVANAGTDETIELPTSQVTLDGTLSTDADGTIDVYAWTKTAGPAGDTIVTPAGDTTLVTGLVEGTYTFQLTVTDNDGATNTDTVDIVVDPNPTEVFNGVVEVTDCLDTTGTNTLVDFDTVEVGGAFVLKGTATPFNGGGNSFLLTAGGLNQFYDPINLVISNYILVIDAGGIVTSKTPC